MDIYLRIIFGRPGRCEVRAACRKSEEVFVKKLVAFLILVLLGQLMFAASGCAPAKDEYNLNIVYTSDNKGFLEECG
jgi:hypothetical protein